MSKIREYMIDNYDMDELKDIYTHGCVSGCASGLIYYVETSAFYDKYHDEIWDTLHEDANDQGVRVMELIATFNGVKDVSTDNGFKNLLAWYAAERVAGEIVKLNDERRVG